MRDDDEPDDLLEQLSAMLRNPHLPVQSEIAREADVDQSLVSRATNGRLIRVTDRVRRLWDYAKDRIASLKAAGAAVDDMDATTIRMPAAPIGRPSPRRKTTGTAFQAEALAGVKAYLDDGYDPRLIVEQIAVLRRAQRLRRSGRRLGDGQGAK